MTRGSKPAAVGALVLRILVAGAAVMVPALTTTPAAASLALEADLHQLVLESDLVVEATPEESHSVWEDLPNAGRRIVTYSRLNVHQAIYGDPKTSEIWVRTLGGQVGKLGQRVEGEAELRQGTRSMLFLHTLDDGTRVVVEMAQGHYELAADDKGARRLRPTVHPAGLVPRVSGSGGGARALLAGKLLDEGAALIRAEKATTR